MSIISTNGASLRLENIQVLPGLGSGVVTRDGKSNVPPNDNLPFSYVIGHEIPPFIENRGHASQRRFNAVPDQSIFKNQPSLLVNCDWLTLRCVDTLKGLTFTDGILIVPNSPYRLQLMDYGTPLFKQICKVFWDETAIAEIQFDSRMAVNADTMYIKYENFIFYDVQCMERVSGDSSVFGRLFVALHTTVLSITRLDICVDGVDFTDFISDFQAGKYEKIKLDNVKVMRFGANAAALDYFTIGSRGGKKYGCCYNKTREIAEKGNKKGYINEYFRANGFDLDKDTWRFEIRLNSEALKDFSQHHFDETTLETPNLLRLFLSSLENFFEFVPTDSKDSRRSRREKVDLFAFTDAPPLLVRVKRQLLEGTRTAKVMVKRHLRDAYLSSVPQLAWLNLAAAKEIVTSYCLENWVTLRRSVIERDIASYASARNVDINPDLLFDIVQDINNNSLTFQ